MLLSEEKLSK